MTVMCKADEQVFYACEIPTKYLIHLNVAIGKMINVHWSFVHV